MTLERAWTIASTVTVGSGGCFAILHLPELGAWLPSIGMLASLGIAITGMMRNRRDAAKDRR